MAGVDAPMEGVQPATETAAAAGGAAAKPDVSGADQLQSEVLGLIEHTANVVEILALASPASPIDPTLCKTFLADVDRIQKLFNHHISVLEEERTELQPSGGIHGDELDTSIATAALKLTESRVNQLLTMTADAPSL
eukprot:m.12515 g.12515  ORF g.12515 m.12515 type:complete len:137 (-) comp7786_c0_seq1:161-571(-)